jgi:hypothetical protein
MDCGVREPLRAAAGRVPRSLAGIEGTSHLTALGEPDEGSEAGERNLCPARLWPVR